MTKQVYNYSSIPELQEKGKVVNVSDMPAKSLCESSQKVKHKAEMMFKQGEDENAYILYWKLCELCQIIVKKQDYKKDEKYFESMYKVKTNFKIALDKIGALENKLEKVYEAKVKEKLGKPPDPGPGTPKSSKKPPTKDTGINGVEQGQTDSKPKENGHQNGIKQDYETMSARDLYSLIQQKSTSYLILDTRNTEDYKKSSIKCNSVNLPEDKLQNHATANALEKHVVSLQDRANWQRRDKVDKLIIVDWNSKDLVQNSPNFVVKHALTNWDRDKTYKNPPIILEGGFELFRLAFPHLVTDPKHKMPDHLRNSGKPKNEDSNLDINRIVFPNLDQGFIVTPSPSPKSQPPAITSGAIRITRPEFDNTTESNIINNNTYSNGNGLPSMINYPDLGSINLVPNVDRSSKPVGLTSSKKGRDVDDNGGSSSLEGKRDEFNYARLSGISVDLSQPNSAASSTSSLNNAMLMNTLDTINGSVAAPPRVDRSSKANAESLYSKANDAKSRGDLSSMLEVESQLADLSIDRRKQDLEKELQWAKLCQKREHEANEDLRAMHDREAERLSEELEARNREVKQYEEKERKLKDELERLREELSRNQVTTRNYPQNMVVESQKRVRFKEEEDQKLKLEVEEIRRKRKLKEQQQLEEKRLLRAQQKAILEEEKRKKAEEFRRLEEEADRRRRREDEIERRKMQEEIERRIKDPVTRRERLKDDAAPRSGRLRRSNSCVNVAQMLDKEDGALPGGQKNNNEDRFTVPVPKFDRKQKPMDIVKRDFAGVWGTTLKPGLTGLRNLGNTCYMNSILQCVSNTQPIVQYFVSRDFEEDINQYSETRGEVAMEFAALLQQLWSHQYKSVSPTDIKSAVGRYKREFSGRDQQDSHEFLSKLLEWLHNDTNRIKKPSNMPEIDCSSLHPEEASKKFWRSFLERNQSIIVQLFHGLTQQTTTCVNCGFKSLKFQEFYNINLFIPEDRNRISLEECLRHYVKETDCEYTCEKCRSTKGAKQKVEIIKLPPILIIHLERFLPDEQMLSRCDDIRYRKKNTFVSYRLNGLNLGEFTRGRENKYTTFNLYAVSNHFGSLEGGHYTATCYSKQGRSWYKYDDQDVSQLDDSSVESSAAYILFYSALDANNPLLPLG